MAKIQRNRIYSLIVGTADDAVEINNLQIKFVVTKTSDNKDKKNDARVEIYNLSEERRRALEEDHVQVSLKVGYTDTGLVELFAGQVLNVTNKKNDIDSFLTRRQNTDLITKLDIDELYTSLNGKLLNKVVPAGKMVGDVIKEIIKDIPEITRQEMNGSAIKRQVPDGYPLSGTPRQNLDNLSRDYDLEWQIDSGILYISDVEGTFSDDLNSVFSIGQFSGLIERPEFFNPDSKRLKHKKPKTSKSKKAPKKKTLRMKILLNPAIIAGSIIKLEFEDLTGYYKVTEVKHEGDFRGNTWHSILSCTEKIE